MVDFWGGLGVSVDGRSVRNVAAWVGGASVGLGGWLICWWVGGRWVVVRRVGRG